MSLNRRSMVVAVAVLAGGFPGAATHAMRVPRIELLQEVRSRGTSVLRSDWLPERTGSFLRESSREISLRAAAEPGNTRVLERGGVLENNSPAHNLPAEIAVPERIVVSRDARPITAEEVFTAIQSAMGRSGIQLPGNFHPEDILLQVRIMVGPGDAGLEVLRSDFDAGLKRGRFLLWTSLEPKVLPFLVVVRFTGDLTPGSGRGAVGPASPSRQSSIRPLAQPEAKSVVVGAAKTEVLVTPGQSATLLLTSAALRMTADVVALERGTLGQQVRVRFVDTGKILSAKVDGRGHLELNF